MDNTKFTKNYEQLKKNTSDLRLHLLNLRKENTELKELIRILKKENPYAETIADMYKQIGILTEQIESTNPSHSKDMQNEADKHWLEKLLRINNKQNE